MWKLIMRRERGTPFVELGDFHNIADAARRINEIEGDQPYESLFFRLYVDPTGALPGADEDASILSSLEYQSAKRFYALTRVAN